MATITTGLRKALQTRSAEELAWIQEVWALESGRGSDMSNADLRDAISARCAWEALSPDAREILHQMITFQVMDGVPREDLQALAGLTDAKFVAALTELERGLMLIETRPEAKVRQRLETRGQRASSVLAIPKDFYPLFVLIDREIYAAGDRAKMTLVQILAKLGLEKVQALDTLVTARNGFFTLGFSADYFVADRLAQSLAEKLVQVDTIELLWEKLDTTDQQICRWLCHSDGSAEVSQVREALHLSKFAFAEATRHLENHGLAFDTFSGQEHKIFIARGVFKPLRNFIGELDQAQARAKQFTAAVESGEKPPIVHEAQSILLYDIAIVANAVYQMVIEPTQAGKIPKRVANKIFPLLHGSRPMYYEQTDYYLDMVFSLAHSLNLLSLKESIGQKPRYMPGPKLQKWAELAAFEQTRLLLDLWEKASDRSWSDVAGANYRPDSYGYGYYIESHASRQALLEYLAEHCQPGKWYALAPFLQAIKALQPMLLRNSSRYAAYGGQRNRKDVLENWERVDGEIITGMLDSSLHELGIVTPGYLTDPSDESATKATNPDAFQLSELAGQVMWDIHPSEQAAVPARTLIVQPNFELLLLRPDYTTLYKLLPFTRVEQVDMVSRLTLTQESVRRGVEAGYGVEKILQTLQTCSQKELPQNVLYTLQDWGKLYKDTTVSQVLLLEVSSETIADEICSSSKLRALELRRLGPQAIAVGAQVSLQVLRTALEKEGVILHIQGDILQARDMVSASTSGYGKRR